MRWTGHVAHVREKRNAHRVLVWKPGGERKFARSRRALEVNISMDFKVNRTGECAKDLSGSEYGQVVGYC
jgi:hypothetical protein